MKSDSKYGQKRLARQVGHDLRSLIAVFDALKLTREEVGNERFELHKMALNRLQKIASNLSDSQYEMHAGEVQNLYSYLKYQLGLKVQSDSLESFCRLDLGDLKKNLQGLDSNEVLELKVNTDIIELSFNEKVLRFKKLAAPSYFVDKVVLKKESKLCTLDDDQFFQKMLTNKYSQFSWSTVQSLHDLEVHKSSETTYFIDYDFGEDKSGLDFILSQKMQGCAYLVTNMDQDPELIKACIDNHVKVISKSLILDDLFKMEYKSDSPKAVSYVLIDDDPLIHTLWKGRARKAGIDLFCFSSVKDFMLESKKLSKDCLIYIDSDLGEGARGEVLAKEIFDLGFTRLKLCTGFMYDEGELPEYILGTCGKRPPF